MKLNEYRSERLNLSSEQITILNKNWFLIRKLKNTVIEKNYPKEDKMEDEQAPQDI